MPNDQTKPSTEVAVQEHKPAPLVASRERMGVIVPTNVEQAYRMAVAIVRGGMAPKSYEQNADRVMVAILHGMEVGLTPMAAVQSIAVINGFPTIWGDGALGLVRASGLLEDIVERIEQKGDELVAICTVQRKGQKTPVENRFSWSEAVRAGLSKKQGPWQQYPRRMMQMRARSWALRDAFPDVLRGLHTAEEIIDMGDAPMPNARPTRAEVERIADAPPKPTDKAIDATFPAPDREPTEAEQREADRLMRQQQTGEPIEEGKEAGEEPEPIKIEPVALMAMKDRKGVPDWSRFASDCAVAIKALPDLAHVDAWRDAHNARLKQMELAQPSLRDQVVAALDARVLAIGE